MPHIGIGIEMHSPRHTGAQGFTLVELVIVMSMMIILVGIVAPRLEVSPPRRAVRSLWMRLPPGSSAAPIRSAIKRTAGVTK